MSALLSLLCVLVLPTLTGVVALSDDPELGHDSRLLGWDLVWSRGLACGLSAWLLGSGVLARTVGLTATSAWIWDATVAAACVVIMALPRQRARLPSVLRPAGQRLAEVAGLTALLFAPLAWVIARTSWSPLGSTPWYYYGLARQVAEAGHIPASSIEFATTTQFLNDYHLFTTGTAMLLVQHPHDPITVLTIVNLVGVLLLGIGAVALTSALGAERFTALLALPVAITTGIGAVRSAGYRPEGFALGLVLLIAALAIDWLRRGDRRSLFPAAVLVATLSQVHGIAALTAWALVIAAVLALLVRGPRGEQLRRTGIALAAFVAAVVVTGLVFREASGTVHAGGLVDRGGLADPTWAFYAAARGTPPSLPPSNANMLWGVLGYLYGRSWIWMAPVAVLTFVGLWRRRRATDVRVLLLFTVLSLIGLALAASVFMWGWQGYVPRRTGASRIPLDASLLSPPLVAIGLGSACEATWRWRRRSVIRKDRRRPLLLVLLSLCGVVSMLGVARYDQHLALSRDDLALWESLPVRSGDVVLTNGYTEGFVPDVTKGVGLLDGRAPYTFDSLLSRANGLLSGANAFFTDPAAHWDYLARNDVRWVVVGDPSTYALSTGNTWYVPDPLDALDQCGGLRKVATNQRLTVYRVVHTGPGGCAAPG
jgi:hypothetical protein